MAQLEDQQQLAQEEWEFTKFLLEGSWLISQPCLAQPTPLWPSMVDLLLAVGLAQLTLELGPAQSVVESGGVETLLLVDLQLLDRQQSRKLDQVAVAVAATVQAPAAQADLDLF